MSTTGTTPTRAQRLDVLPFTGEHRRLLLGSGAGWALDALDVGLVSFIIAQLTVQWRLSPGEASWIASIGFAGMAIGAAVGGLLADRFGRRQVFALTLLVYGLLTGVSALSWSLAALLVSRFLVGLGLGAELPVASTLVSEFAPARIRGRVVVLLESFWAVGWTLAALIGFLVVPRGDDGWRWALALGAVPALYAVLVRLGLPESVRFLEAKGRHDEAEAVVRRFEDSAGGRRVAAAPPEPEPAGVRPPAGGSRVAALWSRPLRRRTAALWAVWFCVNFSYYGAFIWLPSLLYASGFSLVRSFGYTLLITLAQLPGYAVAALLVERWGRRRTLVAALVGSAAAAALFATAGSTATVLAAGMLLSFSNLGAWGALYAVTPELYPTSLRGTGSGWAAGVGRIASVVAPLCVPLLSGAGGTGLVFVVFAAVFGLAAVAAAALPELRGQALADL
ncbi:MFS transporter, putative metabolite:H+ symporter [Friedmanniella luteola]|uniref:MFS transporter, putative metabolite:H+ symporter n=1 Tax=Friedmanniella luteola TaxID=546871 RepID=A0A1H1YMV0_9ACTN|nr:MFS transporter [Friedmanniella luteola]SDT22721.1 MFS transporter, putative metabolite:H+ symporter [Friedmanniella luteola]